MEKTTTHTPADVRERVAFEAFAWEHGIRGAAAEWIRAQWQGETPKRRAMYFDLADRILALLRTPRGEGEAEADAYMVTASRYRDGGGVERTHEWLFLGSAECEEHVEWLRRPQSRWQDVRVTPLYAALRSEAPVGVLDKLRELICDVAASGVAFEDERLDYLEIQIDRQTWDEVCALAARQQGGSDG